MKILNINWWLYLLDVALKRPNVNNGYIDYEPSGTDEIYTRGKNEVLGNTRTVLRTDGNWTQFRPKGELQKRNGSETMSCVSQSACNAIEMILNYFVYLRETGKATDKQKEIVNVFEYFGIIKNGQANSSDRYIAKLSGTTYRGNTQKRVADAIRHYGLVPEEDWGWVNGWNNYYSTIPNKVIEKGKKLAEYIDFNYEWAPSDIVKKSLKLAPLQTSVYAWNGTRNGVYYQVNTPRNHATIRDSYENLMFSVFDSYEPFNKTLARDFNFGWDMIFTISLKKKLEPFNQEEINKLRSRGLKYIMRSMANGEMYELTDNGLKYITATEARDLGLRTLAEKKDFVGISEELYNKLSIL